MSAAELNVVTGAFGYTGKYIAQRLLSQGRRVRTLTNRPGHEHPFGDQIEVFPLAFHDSKILTESLRGATTLYNTYWLRFARGQVGHETAVNDSKTLIRAAQDAGVSRIVHISITHASEDSPLPYFRGKGEVEKAINISGLSYAILRPALVFGPEDILINNMAWLLRRFPLFVIPGSGDYRIQPIHVEDLAELAINLASERDSSIVDAVGPETCAFKDLVRLLARTVGSRARILHLPPTVALVLAQVIGYFVRDVVLTRDEVEGLMSNLLVSDASPVGTMRLSDWLREHANILGIRYASELARHYRSRRTP